MELKDVMKFTGTVFVLNVFIAIMFLFTGCVTPSQASKAKEAAKKCKTEASPIGKYDYYRCPHDDHELTVEKNSYVCRCVDKEIDSL